MTLERTVELDFCSKCPLPVLKLGQHGWPDRMVLLPEGHVLWLEFKRPGGGREEAAQKIRHRTLRELGHAVHIVRSCEHALALVLEALSACGDRQPDGAPDPDPVVEAGDGQDRGGADGA